MKNIKKFIDFSKHKNSIILIFFLRIKFIEFFIYNIKKSKQQFKIFKSLLYIISKIDFYLISDFIKTKIVKNFKIINKLIDKFYSKTNKINIKSFAITIATLIMLNNNITKILKN